MRARDGLEGLRGAWEGRKALPGYNREQGSRRSRQGGGSCREAG